LSARGEDFSFRPRGCVDSARGGKVQRNQTARWEGREIEGIGKKICLRKSSGKEETEARKACRSFSIARNGKTRARKKKPLLRKRAPQDAAKGGGKQKERGQMIRPQKETKKGPQQPALREDGEEGDQVVIRTKRGDGGGRTAPAWPRKNQGGVCYLLGCAYEKPAVAWTGTRRVASPPVPQC